MSLYGPLTRFVMQGLDGFLARDLGGSGLPERFISFLRNFKAAWRSLFFETKTSSTSPSWSTARQR